MSDIREIIESPLHQGVDEQIPYELTVTPWGSTPTSVTVVLKDSDGDNVSSTCLSGTASVSGDIITLPIVKSLTANDVYRLEIKFTVNGKVLEPYAFIYGET